MAVVPIPTLIIPRLQYSYCSKFLNFKIPNGLKLPTHYLGGIYCQFHHSNHRNFKLQESWSSEILVLEISNHKELWTMRNLEPSVGIGRIRNTENNECIGTIFRFIFELGTVQSTYGIGNIFYCFLTSTYTLIRYTLTRYTLVTVLCIVNLSVIVVGVGIWKWIRIRFDFWLLCRIRIWIHLVPDSFIYLDPVQRLAETSRDPLPRSGGWY